MLLIKILILVLILLTYTLVNAFLVAIGQLSESATEEKAQKGDKGAKRILKYIQNEKSEIDRVEATDLRIGLCRLFEANEYFAIAALNVLGAVIILAVAAVILYIFGEMIAKILGLTHSEGCAKKLLNFSAFVSGLIFPAFAVLEFFWKKISKVCGTNPDFDEEVTEENILQMVDDAEESGVLEEGQKEIINNIFEFDDISVDDVMNHRTEIVAVDIDEKLEGALKIAIDEGFSRIPVYEDDLDNIIGIVYVKDLLKYVGKKLPERLTLRSVMREAYHVPQTKRCSELFEEFTEKRIQMAIVVDEYGGTAGIVTLEDLIEFKIEGTCDIEEVEEMLGIKFPDEDYDTLGGFMLYRLGRIPKDDETPSVEESGYKFTALKVKERRIEFIKAEKLPDSEEQEEK